MRPHRELPLGASGNSMQPNLGSADIQVTSSHKPYQDISSHMCTERSMTCTCHTVSAFVFKCHVTYCSMLQCIRACCRSRIERSNCPSCRAISDIYGLCLRCQTSDSSKKNVLAGSALMGARQCLQMNVLCCRCCRSTAVVSCLCCQTILLARHALLVAMVMKVLTGRFGVLGRAGSRCRTRLPEQSVATQM